MPRRDPLRDTLTSGSEARLSLPFLPTLVTAVMIGAASLLCREPAKAPALPAAAVGPQAFAPVTAAEPPARAPAALIFAEHYPLVPGAAARPAPRLAAAASRRQALRAAEPPRRPETLAARPAPADPLPHADPMAPARAAEVAEGESLLPDLVLPFAATVTPAVRAAGETAVFLKDRADSLGGSVSAVMAAMR